VAAFAIAPFAATELELADGEEATEVVVLLLPAGAEVGATTVVVVALAIADEAAHLVQTVTKVVAVVVGAAIEVVIAVTVEDALTDVADSVEATDMIAEEDSVEEDPLEEDPVEDPVEEDPLEAPVMWNGNEYWKVAGLLSRVILMPKVWKSRSLGTDQVYDPVFFTPAAIT